MDGLDMDDLSSMDLDELPAFANEENKALAAEVKNLYLETHPARRSCLTECWCQGARARDSHRGVPREQRSPEDPA